MRFDRVRGDSYDLVRLVRTKRHSLPDKQVAAHIDRGRATLDAHVHVRVVRVDDVAPPKCFKILKYDRDVPTEINLKYASLSAYVNLDVLAMYEFCPSD